MADPTLRSTADDRDVRDEQELREANAETIEWLEDEFPGWEIDVSRATSWVEDELKPIWIARQEGHHPQAELSAAKLHTRLSEYLEREERRKALSN